MQIVALARQYFGLHFQEPIAMGDLPQVLGISS